MSGLCFFCESGFFFIRLWNNAFDFFLEGHCYNVRLQFWENHFLFCIFGTDLSVQVSVHTNFLITFYNFPHLPLFFQALFCLVVSLVHVSGV